MSPTQLHAVFRTQQSRQREPSVRTLRSPLFAEFWRLCLLRGGTQRRAFASKPEQRNGNINLNKYFIFTSGDRTYNQSRPLRHCYLFLNKSEITKTDKENIPSHYLRIRKAKNTKKRLKPLSYTYQYYILLYFKSRVRFR